MQPVSARYLAAWRGGGRRRHRVLLDQGAGFVAVPFTTFAIDAARGEKRVSRYTGTVALPPSAPTIDPYRDRVRCQAGFLLDDDIEWCTLGTLRVEDVEQSERGDQALSGLSFERAVEVSGFERPTVLNAGSGIAAIQSLLADVSTSAVVNTVTDHAVPSAVFETNASRWDAIAYYAEALSVDVHSDVYGNLVIDDMPTLADPPVVTIDAGGVKIGHRRKRSRTGVPSVVVVEGTRTDTGSGSVRGVRRDENPLSPTYYLGAFGRQQKTVTSAVVADDFWAQDMARSILAQTSGLARSLTVTTIPMDFLDPGDVVLVTFGTFAQGRPELHIVDAVPHSSEDSPQQLVTRMLAGGGS